LKTTATSKRLPVGVLVDARVRKEVEDLPYFAGGDHRSKPNAISVLLWNPDAGVIGEDSKLVKADLAGRCGPCLDALHDADAVVRVDDLLTDLEVHACLAF
jgi:hypothetical protein